MRVRQSVLLVSLAVASLLVAGTAQAGPRVTTRTEYYAIRGDTGLELIGQMDRKGPRHGFLRKAVAQTRYTAKPRGKLAYRDGVCRIANAKVEISITVVYPRVTNPLRGKLKRRWALFMKDTVRHERHHIRIARQMAVALDRAIRRFAIRDHPGCYAAKRQYRRAINAIYDEYNRRQEDFDSREHRKGGPVEKSFILLAKE